MIPVSSSLSLALFAFLFLCLGCGARGGEGPSAGPAYPGDAPGTGLGSVYVLPPTATPWPTFTPAPTPTAVLTPVPTQTSVPTATPWPRRSRGGISTALPEGAPTISPTPYGKLPRGEVYLEKQSLVAFWGGDLPDFLLAKEWDRMPDPVRVVSSDIPYLLWVVAFDFTQAEPGYAMPGFLRWLSVALGVESMVMFETPVTVSAESPFFYHGLGSDDGSIWNPGFYRVDLLDDRYQPVVHADFEVRR